jgi:hypothetical protein
MRFPSFSASFEADISRVSIRPNLVLQRKTPPSIFSGILSFTLAGFPLNVIVIP